MSFMEERIEGNQLKQNHHVYFVSNLTQTMLQN